jgi:hypothetical protein
MYINAIHIKGGAMRASVVDLRYHMNDVLKALDRSEPVTILFHGREKGVILPSGQTGVRKKVIEHPFFGMHADIKEPVEAVMTRLRRPRYNAL